MFNRLARLWGKKSEAEQGPEVTATDRAARRDKGETVAESLERYRQERAEEERQAKEAYTRDAEARYGPAATWPRLSETLDGPRHPRFCQSCAVERPPEASDEATPARGDESDEGVAKANDKAKADDSFRLIKAALEPPPGVYGWQEHDGRDEPEPIAVMLCTTCSKRLISPHPRVYSSIPRNAPFPGIMDLCIDCRFRAGVTCTHPDRVSNGGKGLQIDAAPGMWAHARTAVGGRTLTLYAYPPRACAQRSVEGADDEIADEHTGLGEAMHLDIRAEGRA